MFAPDLQLISIAAHARLLQPFETRLKNRDCLHVSRSALCCRPKEKIQTILASDLRFPEGPVWTSDGSVLLVEIERKHSPAFAPMGVSN